MVVGKDESGTGLGDFLREGLYNIKPLRFGYWVRGFCFALLMEFMPEGWETNSSGDGRGPTESMFEERKKESS